MPTREARRTRAGPDRSTPRFLQNTLGTFTRLAVWSEKRERRLGWACTRKGRSPQPELACGAVTSRPGQRLFPPLWFPALAVADTIHFS